MPQGKKLTIDQFLQQPPAPRRPSIDDFLKTPVVQRPPAQATAPPAGPQSLWERATGGLAEAANEFYGTGLSIYEAGKAATQGDFAPAGQMLERAARGGLALQAGMLAPGFYQPVAQSQAPAIAELNQQVEARRAENPQFENYRIIREQLAREAAANPGLASTIAQQTGLFVGKAAPYALVGAAGGGLGAMAATAGIESAGHPESASLSAAGAMALPAGLSAAGRFVAPILRRIRAGRNVGAAAETTPAVGETAPAVAQLIPRPPAAPANPLQSAMQKLGTDDTEQIGEIIANANRRFNKKQFGKERTPEQVQSSLDDQALIEQLTPAEHRALSQVLPPRSYEPVAGGVSRSISDIPAGQPNAQLDANLRELEAFFTAEGEAPTVTTQIAGRLAGMARTPTSPVSLPNLRGEFPGMSKQQFDKEVLKLAEEGQVALHRHDFPGSLSAVERENMVKVGNDYYTAATVRGPAAGSAAFEVKTAGSPPSGAPPPKFTGGGFERPPGQRNLFTGATAAPAERTPLMQTISSFVKAGLLTRPTTHLRNLGSNLGFQVSEEVARIPGAIVDMMIAPFTKRRTLTGPNLGAIGRSAQQAATKGIDDAIRILRTGKTPTEIEGLQEIASGSKIVNAYVNGVFRLLKAEDAVFKSYALKRAYEDRVRSAVLTEIRQGVTPRGEYGTRFRELIKYPPADLANAAVLDAEVATFNNPNITGAIRKGVTRTLERVGQKYPTLKPAAQGVDFAIDRIIPFAKTPANVIARMLEYTPLGGVKNLGQIGRAIAKKSFTAEQQRAFSQTFGRAAAGSGLLALGYVGYRDGWLTGLNEDDTSKRARDTATGRIPGAILINGTWHQITGFSPLGNVIAIGATLAREAEQDQQAGKLGQAGTTAKVIGQAALEQPLLAGTKQFIEGIEQPGTMGARLLGATAGSVVPGAVSDIGQLADYGTQREAQTLGARVMERIPGVRQTLPVRQDVLGQPTQAANPLNPLRSIEAKQAGNPLFAELVRHDIGISGFNKKPNETDEQLRQRKSEFGRLYIPYGIQLVSSPQYQRANDAIQQGAIKTLNSRAKELIEKGKQQFAKGPLSPVALIGAATASQARERAKKNAGRK